jgi:hypothetical protein
MLTPYKNIKNVILPVQGGMGAGGSRESALTIIFKRHLGLGFLKKSWDTDLRMIEGFHFDFEGSLKDAFKREGKSDNMEAWEKLGSWEVCKAIRLRTNSFGYWV